MKSYRYFLFSVSIIAIIIFLFVCAISLNPFYLESFLTKKNNKLSSDKQNKSVYFSADSKYSQFLSEKQYNSFLSYLNSKTGYKFYLYSTDTNEETIDALGSNLIQFALLDNINYATAQKKYNVNLIVKKDSLNIVVNKYADKKLTEAVKKASSKLNSE